MNIGEYCPSQCIILHSYARAIWYTARDNIHQYSCNNPMLLFYYEWPQNAKMCLPFPFHDLSPIFNKLTYLLLLLKPMDDRYVNAIYFTPVKTHGWDILLTYRILLLKLTDGTFYWHTGYQFKAHERFTLYCHIYYCY